MGLEVYRQRINEIDTQLLQLLNDRAQIALKIGAEKQQQALPVYFPDREKQIVQRLLELNRGPLTDQGVREIFTNIIETCRKLQEQQVAG